MQEDFRTGSEKINRYALGVALLVAGVAFFMVVRFFLVYVVVAATFATLFYPLYAKILKWLKGRAGVSSLLCCLVLLCCLLVPAYAVAHLVALQAIDLHKSAEPKIREIIQKGDGGIWGEVKSSRVGKLLRIEEVDWHSIMQETAKTTAAMTTKVANRTAEGVFGMITGFFVIIFTLFYFFRDGERIVARLRYLIPLRRDYEDSLFDQFVLISRATVKGTFLVGLAQGSLGALTLLICGVGSWIVWGAVMIVLSIIPLIGPWLVLVPAGLVNLALGNIWQGIFILVVSTVVVSNVDNLLRPRLVGRDARMHDLIIFFSTLGGIALFGVLGFIVGPVIAALFITLLEIYGTEYHAELTAAEKRIEG